MGSRMSAFTTVATTMALYREAGYRTGFILALLTLAALLTLEMYWLPRDWHASNAAWLMLAVVVAYGMVSGLGPSRTSSASSRHASAWQTK